MAVDPSVSPPPGTTTEQVIALAVLLGGAIMGLIKLLGTFVKRGRNGDSKKHEPAPPPPIDIEAELKEAATLGAIHATVEATKERLEAGLIEINKLRDRVDGFQETIRKTRQDEL